MFEVVFVFVVACIALAVVLGAVKNFAGMVESGPDHRWFKWFALALMLIALLVIANDRGF